MKEKGICFCENKEDFIIPFSEDIDFDYSFIFDIIDESSIESAILSYFSEQ